MEGEEDARGESGGLRHFADSLPARLAALRLVLSLALFAGIMLSLNLWFPTSRTFPRAPLVTVLPQSVIPTVEHILSGLLCAALAASLVRTRRGKYLAAVVILLALLVLTDQMRLQPWVYQYLLLFAVVALRRRQRPDDSSDRLSLSILQMIVATLYFWSGVQKLNYSFSREVLPQLLAPLGDFLPLTQTHLSVLGVGVALVEIFTGCGLLLKRTRKPCVWLALAMHAVVLGLLISGGQNSVVWAWNFALMLMVIVLFWRSDIYIRRTFAARPAGDRAAQAALILATIYAVLPVLNFWGWWDMNLSGALYSGRTAVAAIRVDARVYEKLPETARRQVFTTKSGELVLPVYEWSMADLNVPPYPEARVYRQVAREICKSADGRGHVELIVRGSPAIVDGKYEVIRRNCSQLDE